MVIDWFEAPIAKSLVRSPARNAAAEAHGEVQVLVIFRSPSFAKGSIEDHSGVERSPAIDA